MKQPANYEGVRALVLGASGFIGGWMVRALDQSGASVFAVGRNADRTSAVLARRHGRGRASEHGGASALTGRRDVRPLLQQPQF